MSFTPTPESRSSFAVPPVEISSTPNAGKLAGEFDQSGLIGHAKNGALDFCLARGMGLTHNRVRGHGRTSQEGM